MICIPKNWSVIGTVLSLGLVSVLSDGCTSALKEGRTSGKESSEKRAEQESGFSLTTDSGDVQYVIFKLTHTQSFAELNAWANQIYQVYGPNDRRRKRAWGIGVWGINPLRQSPAEMTNVINQGFDLAERLNVPVHFDILVGVEGFFTDYGSGNQVRWWDDTDMCEWSKLNTPRCTPGWFDWGQVIDSNKPPMAKPALGSPKFRAFLQQQLRAGVFPALAERYQRLKSNYNEYLFAGLALGGETQFDDQTNPRFPVSDWGIMGYNTLRYVANTTPAMLGGRSVADLVAHPTELKAFLNIAAVNDWMRFFSKFVAEESGLPRYKLFTHIVAAEAMVPPVDASVWPIVKAATSPHVLPGFTFSPCSSDTSHARADYMKGQILENERTYGQLPYPLTSAPYIWAIEETYGSCFPTGLAFQNYLDATLGNGAKLMAILGWNDPESSHFFLPKKNPDNTEYFVHTGIKSWLYASPNDSLINSCKVKVVGECYNSPQFSNFNGDDSWGMQNRNSGGDENVCMRRAQEYYDTCGQTVDVTTTFLPTGKQAVLKANYCDVTVSGVCTRENSLSNFNGHDTWGMRYKNAGSVEAACVARANDFFVTCGRDVQVSSVFTKTGKVTTLEPQRCLLQIDGTCPANPQWSNFVGQDDWGMLNRNSGFDEAVCASRAKEYSDTCGQEPTVTTVFTTTGKFTTIPGNTCFVEISGQCPASPGYANYSGLDDWGMENRNAGNSESACVQRAADYYSLCGERATLATTFSKSGKRTQLNKKVCKLDIIGECRTMPQFSNYSGVDDWGMDNRNAAVDENACSVRALDYFTTCEKVVSVRTVFSATGKSTVYNPNSCDVQVQGICANNTAYSNFSSPDVWGMQNRNSGNDPVVCAQRANEYFITCGRSVPVRTLFSKTGQVTEILPDKSCSVQVMGACAGSASLSNLTGLDVWGMQNRNAGLDESACAQRAYDYQSLCKVPVKTTFSSTGKVTALYPANSCTVVVDGGCPPSPGYSNFRGLDLAGMANASAGVSEAACAQRATDYFKVCFEKPTVTTIFSPTGKVTKVGPLQ